VSRRNNSRRRGKSRKGKKSKLRKLRDTRNNAQRIGHMPKINDGMAAVKPGDTRVAQAVKVAAMPQPVDTAWPRGVRNQLRWSPYAWAKLKWFCARGDTEVGGFGVTAVDDMLYVEDFCVIKQIASAAKFDFDDEALNDYLTSMAEKGIPPNRCMRVWVHTHPGGLDRPSSTDEEVFERVGTGMHNIMFILTEDGKTYAELRLRINNMDASRKLSVAVEFRGTFNGVTPAQMEQWEQEYCSAIITEYSQWTGACRPGSLAETQYTRWDDTSKERAWCNKHVRAGSPLYTADAVVEDRAWRDERINDAQTHDYGNIVIDDYDDAASWCCADDECAVSFDKDTVRLVIEDGKMDVQQWVYTNKYWFRFGGSAVICVKAGDMVQATSDLASCAPNAWGEIEWKPDPHSDDMELGELLTAFVPQLGFVTCGEDGEPFADALTAAEVDTAIADDMAGAIADEKEQVKP
jgi:hypothetical protein